MKAPIFVTGVAGFIGFHVAQQLLSRGESVVGIDNLNDYYDIALKQARLDALSRHVNAHQFQFFKQDIADYAALTALFTQVNPSHVVHLAAQAGVRYSLINPHAYAQSNLVGFTNILEACRHHQVAHLVYASSSSVYGGNTKMPFAEDDNVDHPLSLYAATKKANELMAHTYSHLYQLPTTGLRFFTVYGPWGRPDMAPCLFADAILNHRPIQIFNHGKMMRDFTYIDDIVEGVLAVLNKPATPAPDTANNTNTSAPYRIFNIGNNQPEKLMDFVGALEAALGQTAEKILLPMQAGDVVATYADTAALEQWVGFKPKTPIKTGVKHFADWYLDFYA